MKLEIKTRLDILTDIEDELCVRLPIHIFPSDTNFNDRWVSVESLLKRKSIWYSDSRHKPQEEVIILSEDDIKELEKEE
jgi:hypothetical protein